MEKKRKTRHSSEQPQSEKLEDQYDPDPAYFASYENLGVHQDMLCDTARTNAYRQAIEHNASAFRGKTVLDVGAGTGILSLFCARAGARMVYAVEASEMATYCQEIVTHNGYADTITVLRGKVEEVELPEKVDIIVSEWMGYFLVYESMLDSVIVARDRWLKPEGLMFPQRASLHLCPFNWDEFVADHVDHWLDTSALYGFSFAPLQPLARRLLFREPLIEAIGVEHQMADACVLQTFDCTRVTQAELVDWTGRFSLHVHMNARLHGFAAYFEVHFPGDQVLSTAPHLPPTHWHQTLLFIDQPLQLRPDARLQGHVRVHVSPVNRRQLELELEFAHDDELPQQKNFTMR